MADQKSGIPESAEQKPSPHDPQRDLDRVFDEFCERLDDTSLKQTRDLNEFVRNVRSLFPECADEIELIFDKLHCDVRFGTILSTYIKTQWLRPVQKKYRRTQ